MNDNLLGRDNRHLSAAYEYIRASAGGAENAGPETITVEEGIDCREADSRFFNLFNRTTRLNVIISKNSTILSCKLHDHEVIVSQRPQGQTYNQDTWALGDRPIQRMASLAWNCHVRGTELLLSASNSSSSIIFELNNLNELNIMAKLKSMHLQNQVTYFNLNNARDRVPIDGHTLAVQCNGNLNRIYVQETKLLTSSNNRALISPSSLISELPHDLTSFDTKVTTSRSSNQININGDDDAICDAIYSLESSSNHDFLSVKLQFNRRRLTFEVRASTVTNPQCNQLQQQQQASVSSSTGASLITSSSKILNRNTSPASNDTQPQLSEDSLQATSSTSRLTSSTSVDNQCHLASSSVSGSNSTTTSLHPATTIRARVRVTNFGVCVMPLMMSNYNCTYRFNW